MEELHSRHKELVGEIASLADQVSSINSSLNDEFFSGHLFGISIPSPPPPSPSQPSTSAPSTTSATPSPAQPSATAQAYKPYDEQAISSKQAQLASTLAQCEALATPREERLVLARSFWVWVEELDEERVYLVEVELTLEKMATLIKDESVALHLVQNMLRKVKVHSSCTEGLHLLQISGFYIRFLSYLIIF